MTEETHGSAETHGNAETHEFKTEVNRLLDLVIHSLYSHKEIFLRELISNASDAVDKMRYESLVNAGIDAGAGNWKIKVTPDADAGTITVSDNGIGMTREEAVRELGTIARSGTTEFLKNLKDKELKDNPELIGQFGVGFYSSFMVADKVTVVTRNAHDTGGKGVRWESEARGGFTIEEADRATPGTDVILHLKADEKEFLKEWKIKELVRKYSDYIAHPIVMDIEREVESAVDKSQKIKVKEEEVLNSMKAIWLKDKSEISKEEYNEFYKHVSHDYSDPARVIHYKAEGTSEFSALLFIPVIAGVDIFYEDFKVGPALYVKRVRIMDHCEDLLPRYLRFVKGVVDSSDLPLNVSRELLQNNRQVEVIKKSVTKKVLDTLAEQMHNERSGYEEFFEAFGKVLKEGVHFDFSRKEAIADILLFKSTDTPADKYTTLNDYAGRMKEGQAEIYYITAASVADALKSPYIEVFQDKGFEVLVMLDEVDDIIFNRFEYKGKKFKSVVKGDVKLDKAEAEETKKTAEKYRGLLDMIKERLKGEVRDVRFSGRLKGSPCCLVADEDAPDPAMERLLRSMGKDIPQTGRTLELNPAHPLVEAMERLYETDAVDAKLARGIKLLYDQAVLLEGGKLKDPGAFAASLSELMLENIRTQGI